MKTVVVLPMGAHPFHPGHYALYQSAVKTFPGADVYIAATADTSQRPFPFQIKQKLAKLSGVPENRFVQVKSPFQAREITANLDPENTQLIFVRSEKDANKPPQAGGVKKNGEPSYLQPLAGNEDDLLPMNQRAYMAYLPTVEFGPGMTSATEIRSAWPTLNERRKTALVMSLYPATQKNPALAANVVKMLDAAIGSELGEDLSRRGFLQGLGAAALAGAASGVMAQKMPNVNAQQVELSNKYYNALVQRAKEDGRELDRRVLNFLRAKADEAAAQKFQQNTPQQNTFPSQGSERKVSKDIGQFESQGLAEDYIDEKK